MYQVVTIEKVSFEVEYQKTEPEEETNYPGDVEIYNLEIGGTDVHDLFLNEAPALLEKIKLEILNQ